MQNKPIIFFFLYRTMLTVLIKKLLIKLIVSSFSHKIFRKKKKAHKPMLLEHFFNIFLLGFYIT